MTFEQILEILKSGKTEYQVAADLHAAILKASTPSALNLNPMKERKKREARKPATPAADLMNGHDSTETAQ